jgi:uncharacterized membrane protein
MPRVESSIFIKAPRETVIAVARNNEQFPQFMADVQSVTVLSKSEDEKTVVSEWVGIVPKFGNRITWVEEDHWDLDAGTCTFRQIRGDYDEFSGVWSFVSDGPAFTRFDSYLDYRLEIPLVGPLIKTIIQKTMQNNLDATLRAIKERAEEEEAKGR